ncbi:2-oxoacid dehydrogenases acyltransferase-domain-containing protein [Dichotomocladium elegans]|nr:2-oxoacid dehydrogenases acyltransferase-domain-containing protein [Dichotomocladium elegans]
MSRLQRRLLSLVPRHQHVNPSRAYPRVFLTPKHSARLPLASRSFHAAASLKVIKPYLLADIGEGITECEVVQWFVEPGATVAEFDKICEVQSDKASVEITSRFAGKVVKLHYDVNEVAKVGQPLVDIDVLEEEGEVAVAPPPPTSASTVAKSNPEGKPVTQIPTSPSNDASPLRSLATPAVRRMIKENNIDILDIQGTGKDGRVLKEDVLAYLSNGGRGRQTATSSTPSIGASSRSPSPLSSQQPQETDFMQPLTAIQRAMFKSMTKSVRIPQLGYKDEMELNVTSEYRDMLNKYLATRKDQFPFQKLSYMPIFIKCLSVALSQYPILNTTLVGDSEDGVTDPSTLQLQYRAGHNIGIAMDTPQGLLVPNIKNVQQKSILEVAAELYRLSELGAKNSIPPADFQGGTITISNIGTIGGIFANPCLISSEMAIVALGKMQKLPRFDDAGQVVAKQILPVSWSADHRIIDGATIARFGNHWKTLVENPMLLASELR